MRHGVGEKIVDDDRLEAHLRLAAFNQQLRDVRDGVFEILDELDAIEILREHVPAHRQWLLDRLALALDRAASVRSSVADAEWEVECEIAEEEDDSPAV